jgi:hypothetical protein
MSTDRPIRSEHFSRGTDMHLELGKWVPRLAIPALLIMVWVSRIPQRGGHPMERVTLAQLEAATKGQLFITYQGLEQDHHRFQTEDGRVFRVRRDELDVPMAPPTGAGIGLFVTIEGGKMRTPDPRKMAEWARRRGLDGFDPSDMAAFEGARPTRMPVVRHRDSPEPDVLILTSDGDWSDADLGRLDHVLAAWIREEWPGRRKVGTSREPAPLLRYDKSGSAADRKTIVVRAEHFNGLWCEALADRLIREFPFLWKLEVGRE